MRMVRQICWAIAVWAIFSTEAAESKPNAGIRWPALKWERTTPEAAGMDQSQLQRAREYALTGEGSGYIVRGGSLVMEWGDPRRRYDLKSTTKSFGSIALGVAIKDGKVRLDAPARSYHPTLGVPPESNAETGWLDRITIYHLASQTAGFEKPGGHTGLLFEPGTKWDYSDSGPNWLAECITLVYGRDLNEWMIERVFEPLGIGRDDLIWRKNAYRPATIEGVARREFGAGIHANVDAMARIGYLMLREGTWNGREILTKEYVALARARQPQLAGLPVLDPKNHGNAPAHYGLLWWNNADRTLPNVPSDAYWSWGLYDSLIVVIPSLDVVVARAGKSWKREPNAEHYDVLEPFLTPIVKSITTAPPSAVIDEIQWAPADTIVRKAKGSDNWPMTWADDDALYGAYGDGYGFEPFVPEKLSMGLVRVDGDPPHFVGENIRAPSLETKGDGRRGKKASGLLMVDGVLYLWARNAGNSQLAWSDDRGATWNWADWKFRTSFGCPTFLNFGQNYAGATDDYVYIYSQDTDSAYERADCMVLARVPKASMRNRNRYEFLERLDADGRPVWTKEIERRGAVLTNPGRCYRSNVTYNAGLKRYFWVQTGLGVDTRFEGGLAIYEGPEPWGPWHVVYATENWDVGPGESASFPTKWMSADGRTMHLVFSGDDHFSVRRATVRAALGPPAKKRRDEK